MAKKNKNNLDVDNRSDTTRQASEGNIPYGASQWGGNNPFMEILSIINDKTKTTKDPNIQIGEPTFLPGTGTTKQIEQSTKLMETIKNFWKNVGKNKLRVQGTKTSGILTQPGTSPTTFNGQNIQYIYSPKGGPVTHKFYTEQGSEYILTKDGFARRVKSPHGNTGGKDAGLHNWNKGATRFIDDPNSEINFAYHAWTDISKPLGFQEKNGVMTLMVKDNGKWRPMMRSEVRPSAVKNGTVKEGPIQQTYTTYPRIGTSLIEYGTNTEGGINWFHGGSPVSFIEGMKKGGKMNIIEKFKKGSRIHIKKENRGKFTDYCGGEVTSACIAKGKASSNPTIRKRATFADNARKWKHKNGGFVKGVNVLDSNPKAYKYVKKKYKKGGIVKQFKLKRFFQEGGKFDWGQVAQMAMQAYQQYQNDKQKNEAIDAQINALKEQSKVNKQKLFNQNYKRFLNQQLDNSQFGKSDLVNRALAYQLANNMDYDDNQQQIALLSSQMGYDGTINGVGNLLGTFLNSGIFNKNNQTYNSSITAYNSGNVNKDLAGTSFVKPDSSNQKIKTNTGLNITVDDIRKLM